MCFEAIPVAVQDHFQSTGDRGAIDRVDHQLGHRWLPWGDIGQRRMFVQLFGIQLSAKYRIGTGDYGSHRRSRHRSGP